MTLIEDIVLVAGFCRSDYPEGVHPAALAGERILAAHANGGLPRAILGQKVQELESRLVTEIRRTAEELSRGG